MQRTLLSKSFGLLKVLLGALVFVGLSGCSGSGSSSGGGGGGSTPVVTPTVITIDNAGVIPVFGNSSTSTVVYVHNNSNTTVGGISYSALELNSSAKSSFSSKLLSLLNSKKGLSAVVNGSQCSTIAAGQSCPLSIFTPVLNGSNLQGSLEVKASYTLNNKVTTFTQLISYAQVQNNLQPSGAKFQTGVSISGYGNSIGYGVVYLYGSGQNQVYDVSSMIIDKPAVTVANGNISGHQIQSNFVQAVEVSSPILSSAIGATITVNSTQSANSPQSSQVTNSLNKSLMASKSGKSLSDTSQFSNSASITVEPSTAGAILTTGLVPLINTVNGTSGSMLVRNSGNQAATIGAVTAGAGISNLSGCSSTLLGVGATCTINFNVTESGGSANITVPYTGGSASNVVGNVTWYNGSGAALVSMSSSDDPLSFSATVGGSTTITVTNIGGYALTNISIPNPIVQGGSATATLGTNACSSLESLAIGASCTYVVNVNDNEVDLSQQINVGFSASYAGVGGTSAYSRVLPIIYNSIANGAIVAITPVTASMTISGNSVESTSTELTISNSGNLPANITLSVTGNQPSYLVESSNTCTSTLGANSSCVVTLVLGPTYSSVESSGTVIYTVDYTAGGQVPSGSVSSHINWQVQAYAQSISLESYTAFGASSGDGQSAQTQYEFIALGRDVVSKSITLIYKNTGTNAVKITGIQDTNSVYTWEVGGGDTTCLVGTTVLQPNGTCKLVYINVFESNILALGSSVGTTYVENLIVPTLIYQDAITTSLQFQSQPGIPTGGTTIYAQSNQATLANTITVNEPGTSSESITVSHLLANADDTLNVTVTTKMENYFVTPPTVIGLTACTSDVVSGILTQTCIMGKDNLSMSATYLVNQTLLDQDTDLILSALFSTDGRSQIVSMNPTYEIVNLGTLPLPNYAYIVDSGSASGRITQCIADTSTGELSDCRVAVNGGFSNPRQIAIYRNVAYVTSTTGSVSKCALGFAGISSCADAGSGLSNVNGIAFNNGLAYISSIVGGVATIQKCNVADSGGGLSNCVADEIYTSNDSFSGMTTNNGYLYTTGVFNGVSAVLICQIDPSSGALSSCSQYSPVDNDDNSLFVNPSSIAINNGFAYITNSSRGNDGANGGFIIQCAVNQNGLLSNCAALNPDEGFYIPSGISISNGVAYITNTRIDSVSSCQIDPVTGWFNPCIFSGTALSSPFGIVTNFP